LLQVFTRRVAGTEKPANDLPQQERLRVADISAGRRTVITLLGPACWPGWCCLR